VGAGLSKAILANDLQLNSAQRDLLMCCAELEFAATDTRGNARAARIWAETNKVSSLYLVTANYHMPRARLAFEREMPHIDLQYWSVSPDDLRLGKLVERAQVWSGFWHANMQNFLPNLSGCNHPPRAVNPARRQ
jgi:uncharacterized SAM-binding protein YcdF (DUF218 family)